MNVGGTARYVGELVKRIPNSKLATGFIQASEIEDSSVSTFSAIRINHLGRKISPINDYKAWRELSSIVQKHKPAIIHTHTFKAGLIGRLISGPHKHVHTFHGHLFDDNSFSALSRLVIKYAERFLAHHSDALISVGQNVGKELREAGIGKRKKWKSIPPGVEALTLIDKRQARKSIGLDKSTLLIGWMARMTSVKNPHLLLDVANHLPNIQFVMAGGGDLFELIKSIAPENVKLLGWADATTFLSAVDIIISTSDNEGMPIALIEAQLAGIPVIATNVGSSSEVVIDEETGFITIKRAEEIVTAIKRFTESPDLIKTFGRKGKKHAKKEFSLDKMTQSHADLYRELVLKLPESLGN